MNIQWKKGIKTVLIILCMVVLLSAVGCNRQGDVEQASGISFREASVTVERYETCTLELQGAEGKQIEWKTGDESVATVQDGVICGWKKGNTQILACVDGEETACNIIVTDNQYVPVIHLRETDELALDLGGTYTLKPTLHYNAKEYTDVEYTYSCVGDAVTVDENGVIQAAKTGEAVVCVQGKWRSNVVQSSLTVYVIDVSTSVEVSGKAFDIYLNSQDKEFPSSADLGISVFDKDTPIEEEDASIKYIELLMEGDVEGAATVKDGVVYAKKIGTTHFVAEYTPATGEAVRTTVFTVNVHKSPAEIYMSPIAGEEYEFFITPMRPDNSVQWDENMGAFHLINKNANQDDGRAFLFSGEYIEKILRYTNAKSIVFEVMNDGIHSGTVGADQFIYQGFYPDWYDHGEYLTIDKKGEWTKIEIFFDEIPLDKDGNRKSIMLLSSTEGMYVRNICPRTEGSFLTMDVEITTLGGNWRDDIEIGAYPYSYKGSINDYTNRVAVKAGVKTTIKYRLDDFLEGGRVPGFGIVIFGGPEWNAKLSDGYTPDRHTVKISNLRVSGETNYRLDLSTAAWATGKDGTGFTDANGSGIPSYEDGAIIITNGFRYDGHKFTLDSEEAKNRTYLYLDMQIDTLGGDWLGDIEMRFYPHNFEGNPHEVFADKVAVKAGKQVSVRLDAKKYLIDGELPGIGLGVFGGPTWDATLPDGYTPDRHTVTITGVRLEGALNKTVDLSYSECISGTKDTGYTVANGSGQASIVDGTIVISNGFCYDCHKITFGSAESQEGTYVCLDMQIDTLGGNWTNDIEMRFYAYNFEGNPHEDYTDKVIFKAGEQVTVRLKADDYLVDGKLGGIGIGIFGGPEWNTQISDGVYDRHTVTISDVYLAGEQSVVYDLSKSTCISGTGDTGYTVANGSGVAAFTDGVLKITNGFCYDCHKISLTSATEPGETEPGETEPGETEPGETEPGEEEQGSYIELDMQIDTLGGNWANDIEMRFYAYDFQGNPHEVYTDSVTFKAGVLTTVKLDAEKYLVDETLPGIGIGIFGGPTWDAKLPDGSTPDRHTVTISDVRLTGEQVKTYDLSKSTCISGTGDTGYTVANGSGVAAFTDGALKITNGFCYDCHKISLTEATQPGTEEQGSYVELDMQIDTLGGNWGNDIGIRFYPYNFEGNPHEVYTDSVTFKAGEQQTVKLDAEKYLVDGKLTGIGIGIFGGPAWDAKLPDGYTPDRHTVTISDVRLTGEQVKTYDLSKSTCISGTGDTGYTVANGSGVAAFTDGALKITNGFCYDCHKISLTEATQPGTEEQGSYVELDMQIDTLGGNWGNDIGIRFYPYNFEGNPHEVYTDSVTFKAGEQQTVKLDAEKYLVDGKLTGIGIGIFGGPEWNTQISAGVYDRHTVTISDVRLTGEQVKTYDLSKSVCISGTGDTGYTVANGSGVAAFTDGALKITNGFCYDCHKISLTEATQPGAEEQETYIVMDLLLTTLGNSTNPVEMRFCIYNQEESVHTTYTDKLNVTPGTKTTVRLNVDKYLVNGELPGFGIAIFGGPEWNTQLSNGTYDRHSVVISDLRLEGAEARDIDLSTATVSTGIPGSNTGGQIAIVDGQIVISGGFRYDGHLITFGAGDRGVITRQLHALPVKKELQLQQESISDPTAP